MRLLDIMADKLEAINKFICAAIFFTALSFVPFVGGVMIYLSLSRCGEAITDLTTTHVTAFRIGFNIFVTIQTVLSTYALFKFLG